MAIAVLAGLSMVAGPAAAQSSAPSSTPSTSGSPSPGPRVDGAVSGSLRLGGRLEIRVDASVASGWRGLHVVEVLVFGDGRELERLALDVDNSRLVVGDRYILLGTAAVGEGAFLRVSGAAVALTTGGSNLSVVMTAEVLRALPADVRFSLSVTDDAGVSAAVTRRLAAPGSGGIGWSAVAALAAAALLLGGFAGNLLASRRRPPPRLSVYGAVERRLAAERSTPDRGG